MALVVMVLAAPACASWTLDGRHFRWWYIDSFVVEPSVLGASEVASITLITGQDIPPDAVLLMYYPPPEVHVTAGALFATREEAHVGVPNDHDGTVYYSEYDPLHLRLNWGNTVYWRAPAEPQVVTITAEYHTVTKSTTVQVVGAPVL
jgi:hypothetical protein